MLDQRIFDVSTLEDDVKEVLETTHDTTGTGASSIRPPIGDGRRFDRRSTSKGTTDTTEIIPSTPTPSTVEEILAERGKTHGDFTDNARVMQSMKRIVHAEVGWDRLDDVKREAIHMIIHKIGRIISGNPEVKDHWDDIAGYAKLVSERVKS